MASMASLINLGGVDMIFVHKFESPLFLVRSVTFRRNYNNFETIRKINRESHVCACVHKDSVTTDYRGIRGTNNNNDAHRRRVRRPMLNSEPKGDPLVSIPWQETQPSRNSGNEKLSDGAEMSMVVDSLGKVLEKVEKNLGTSMKASISENEPPLRRGDVQKNGKPVKSVKGPTGKVKTLKSVWQRASSAATVKKVVKERTKPDIRTDDGKAAESHSVLPENVQSKLQENPFAKESVHLKSVNSADMSHDRNGTDLVKVRKPILMDKFASKKPVVHPLISQAVLPPPKQRKSFTPKMFKDKYRKKSSSSEGPRRRIIEKDEKITEEDTNELNVSIPGGGIARKGQKWTKAKRRAVRRQAACDAMPVRVEIMEVGEDGMLTEDLAYNLAIGEGEILGYLYSKGIKPDGVQKLSNDMVKMVCKEYGVEVIDAIPTKVEEMAKKKKILEGDLDQLEGRPPVLTIMGHVDHGKTTLLDYIRKSKVVAGEAGGITQGIGAYKVQVPFDGKTQTCVFLDTPGHEAFGAMRARGTRVTDIAIIVVAADDGIQPQTNEAFAHAKAAGVPIVVAINKIDKDGANPDRVMQDLSSVGLMPEDWGGDIPTVKISALKGENVDELLETVMLVAELQELKANPHRRAKGTVIEAGLDKAKGPVTTFIVQNGTLRIGEVIVCGEAFGKVRALFDDSGKHVDEAGPSIPVQVLGLNNVPLAGDEFEVVDGHAIAREKAEARAEYLRKKHIMEKAGDGKVTLASFASAVSSGKNSGLDLHELSIILKVDVQGSIEAIRQALQVLPHDNVTLKFLLQATGDVNKSDIDLAVASKAIIFGFNVKVSGSVKSYSDNKKVEIRLYKVIYELIDDVRNTMEGLLDLVEEQVQIGSAEVRAIFSSGSSQVAGCVVMEGKLVRECGIRVIRKGKEIHIGILNSLKRIKEMVKEVHAGLECGVGVEGFSDWEAGDMIETFNTVPKRRTLEEASATMSAALKQVGIQV